MVRSKPSVARWHSCTTSIRGRVRTLMSQNTGGHIEHEKKIKLIMHWVSRS